MIELQQFILWLIRKIVSAIVRTPKRWHDRMTDLYEYDDWFIPVMVLCLLASGVGLGLGIFFASTGHSYLASIVLLSVWGTGILFIVSTGVRYMYRAFKAEQEELVKALKQ
jgi:hypothetical protein